MLLAEDAQISRFDRSRWVINTRTGRNLLVNEATAQLFRLLGEHATLPEASLAFNHRFGAALSPDEFAKLINDRFGGYHLLHGDEAPPRPTASPYIKLKMELLPPAVAGWCAAPLRPFYTPVVFWCGLTAMLSFLLVLCLKQPVNLHESNTLWVALPLLYSSIFVHELGHIAACARFGVRHGGVGFGFYLFLFPVLYADITNIWVADRQRRIIANLGGVFSQLLMATALAWAFLVTAYAPFQVAAFSIAVAALWQLNPFVRSDGYWLLSDLSNTPNLLDKASAALKQGLGLRLQPDDAKLETGWKFRFLFIYGIINSLVVMAFAFYVLAKYYTEVIEFPIDLLSLLRKCLIGTFSWNDINKNQLVVLGFYVMLLRYGFASFASWRSKNKVQRLAPIN